MTSRSFLLAFSVASLGLLQSAQAQGEGPERRRRHYNGQARPYYRGPVRFTLGGGVGLYSGDLTSGLTNQFPGASLSLGLLYRVRPHWQVGAEAAYFQIGAKDYLGAERGNQAFRGRNGAGVAFLRYEPLHDEGTFADPRRAAALIKPYLKVGAGFLLYSPKAYIGTTRPEQSTTFLPPERQDYPAVALVAPVGVGLTLRLSRKLNASLEGTYHFTTTDQLDDISPALGRSSSNLNDGYGLAELKLEYAPWRR
ncbi:hypothetical protein [Hymenobacter weizhouensis]|uniref:hypothetical protein n=1 Tax=Hymenobacter sp. YIM 151500-1 TaxID=2987689 RepID=UPI0022265C3B|nr:hypothetical protein [Hymenobacter sp. YIM 151500-1]UYZ62569.1 hypothetical protein OIS53_16405 [Hymenobacter sp. YIM 151500-1]